MKVVTEKIVSLNEVEIKDAIKYYLVEVLNMENFDLKDIELQADCDLNQTLEIGSYRAEIKIVN